MGAAALFEKAPFGVVREEVVKEPVELEVVVVGDERELEEACSVGASPGACVAGRPVTAGMPYASSAPALRGTLLLGSLASVGPLLVCESGTVEAGGVAIARRGKGYISIYIRAQAC